MVEHELGVRDDAPGLERQIDAGGLAEAELPEVPLEGLAVGRELVRSV
jgi:hypothetical protein